MEEKKNTQQENTVWKVIRIINYIALLFYVVCSVILMTKVCIMKVLPMKYFVPIIVLLLLLVVINILLRKKKAANVIFIILTIIFGIVFIIGYQMVDKVDEVVEQVTEGADVQVTVMEIRVLSEDETSSVSQLDEYEIGIMETRDRTYVDKVLDNIKKEVGDDFDIVEVQDDPIALVDALYNGDVDAIIINSVYTGVFEEVEGYTDFATKTKVVQEVEIEEKIASKKEAQENANKEQETTAEGENPSQSSNGNSSENSGGNNGSSNGGYDYGTYGEWGGGFVYEEPTSPAEMSKSAFVVYISGIDTYGNVNRKSRSDVNILMAVNTETKKILMVNTPRDYYVPLSVSGGVKDKLTHAGNYGVECSRDTLGMLYGVTADYYVRMNFTGFIDIIDAMGGVDVNSEVSFNAGGRTFNVGMNYDLTGSQALAFARERKTLAAGDNQRGRNQMALITGMIKKIATADVIMNYRAVLEAIAGSFQTNLTSEEIYALVQMQINDMATWSVESYSVTGTGASKTTYSIPSMEVYVMEPNYDTVNVARQKIQAVLSGQ